MNSIDQFRSNDWVCLSVCLLACLLTCFDSRARFYGCTTSVVREYQLFYC